MDSARARARVCVRARAIYLVSSWPQCFTFLHVLFPKSYTLAHSPSPAPAFDVSVTTA